MKKLLLILLCFPMIGFGQGWETTFGGIALEFGYSVQQTTDGGYILGAQTTNTVNANYDIYLIKTDGNGTEQWSQTYGDIENEGGIAKQTTDGGYIIGGWKSFGNQQDYTFYLMKTDGNGIEQWNQTYAQGRGGSVQQTTDGGYIIAGRKDSLFLSGHTERDVYLIKTDGNGVEQWNQTFGGINRDWGSSVQQTTDGGYIILGTTLSFGDTLGDVYLIKTDGNGVEQWNQTFGGVNHDAGYSVHQTTDGGYIIAGGSNSNMSVYLIKTDGSGAQQWSKTFGNYFDPQFPYYTQQTTDGGYIISGTWFDFDWTTGTGNRDIFLLKTDGNGDSLWTKTYGGVNDDVGSFVQQTTDGGYIIIGSKGTGSSDSDVYLIKTDGNGNVTSTFNIPINPNRKLEKTVDILGKETIPQINTPFIEIYDDGTVEKKIIIE